MIVVTVDLADLETVVFATGVIKSIEGALNARRDDPFVRPHLKFTDAHNRLAAAMRNAKRTEAGTAIGYDEPLSDQDFYLLMSIEEGLSHIPPREKIMVDSLVAKGCVVLGSYVRGISWGSDAPPELTIDPEGFPARITDRGRQQLVEAKAKRMGGKS